jgi:hypothetical protein
MPAIGKKVKRGNGLTIHSRMMVRFGGKRPKTLYKPKSANVTAVGR